MILDYRKETAKMLKVLRKAGYSNEDLRRAEIILYCRDTSGNLVRTVAEIDSQHERIARFKDCKAVVGEALSLGYQEDNLYLQIDEDDEYGYTHINVLHSTQKDDSSYYYQILVLFKESTEVSEEEKKLQAVRALLGQHVTAYTMSCLKNILK